MLLSSKEMAKSCIMYNLGKRCLENGDVLSSGVNLYYSLYHACLSVISSTSNKIEVQKCVTKSKRECELPRYYVPLSHTAAKKLTGRFDKNLADELDKLMQMREYLSYGPNVLYGSQKEAEISEIILYDCRFPNLMDDIQRMNSDLHELIAQCCVLLKERLSEGNFWFFMFYFYKMTDIIGRNLNLDQTLISECQSILDSFDKEGIRNVACQV